MRQSREEKQRSHERIVEVAARRIREAGTEAPGVAEIMRAAGMTHGGFYKHFASREALLAEAAERACSEGSERVARALDGAEDPLAALVTTYLSPEHRDDPGSGCAVAALGGDVARSGEAVRGAYTDQVRRYIDRVADVVPGISGGERRERAIGMVSTLVGALVLARGVGDPELADEILGAARAALGAPID